MREIDSVVLVLEVELFTWLTPDQAYLELCNYAIKHWLTVKQTSEQVAKLKEVIKLAQNYYSQLSPDWQPAFVESLAKSKARSKAEVQFQNRQVDPSYSNFFIIVSIRNIIFAAMGSNATP